MPGIGAVDLGCLAYFSESVSEQATADVLHSTLLAQLVADREAIRATDPAAWRASYRMSLSKLQWVLQGESSDTIFVKDRPLLVEDAVLPRVATGPADTAGLSWTITVFRLLPATNDAVARFNGEVLNGKGACQLQVCVVTQSGDAPEMCLVDIDYTTATATTDPLIDPIQPSDDAVATVVTLSGILDEDAYAAIRASVDVKVGSRIREDITRLAGQAPRAVAA